MNTTYELLAKSPGLASSALTMQICAGIMTLVGIVVAVRSSDKNQALYGAVIACLGTFLAVTSIGPLTAPDYVAVQHVDGGSIEQPELIEVDEETMTLDGVTDTPGDEQLIDGVLTPDGYDRLGSFSNPEQLRALITENEN